VPPDGRRKEFTNHRRCANTGFMGCGECAKKVLELEQRVSDLTAVLDELRTEYLDLAKDFDELVRLTNGEENEDE